jgi:hypothetical protein
MDMKSGYKGLLILATLFTPLLFTGLLAPLAFAATTKGTPSQLFPSFSSVTTHKESSATIIHTPMMPAPRPASSTKPINTVGLNWGVSTTSQHERPLPPPTQMMGSSTQPKMEIGHTQSTTGFLQDFFGRIFH